MFTTKFSEIKTAKDMVVFQRVQDHLTEMLNNGFKPEQIFFIALEGSFNYELDLPNSDVDTKLILVPTLDEFIYNHRSTSTTHIRDNDEHTTLIDVRNYFSSLRKQNVNFIEILFSPWIIVNTMYEDQFQRLYENREAIARYDTVKSVKTINGIATDRFKAIYNLNSSRANVIREYGYDGKAISHLHRIEQFLFNYISGCPYRQCLIPTYKQLILDLKQNKIEPVRAKNLAETAYETIQKCVDNYIAETQASTNIAVEELLNNIQEKVIKKAIMEELNK